ncbi:MAG TPA: hypothetical protein VGF39_05360 [Stellaceae bacterium]|jgi:hypothetical protein
MPQTQPVAGIEQSRGGGVGTKHLQLAVEQQTSAVGMVDYPPIGMQLRRKPSLLDTRVVEDPEGVYRHVAEAGNGAAWRHRGPGAWSAHRHAPRTERLPRSRDHRLLPLSFLL